MTASSLSSERNIRHRGFSDNLLSVRGIAAMMVLIFHAMLIFQVNGVDMEVHKKLAFSHPAQFVNELIIFMTNGSAAVTFFFVHSGFVLALSMTKYAGHKTWLAKVISTLAYYVKRLLRFYPMIIATTVLAYYYQKHAFAPLTDSVVSAWFRKFFTTSPHLTSNIFLQKFNLNPFLWSLRIELLGSLLMPLFYFAARRVFTAYLLLFVFYLYANNFLPEHTTKVTCVMCFFLGALLGTLHADLQDFAALVKRNMPAPTSKWMQWVYRLFKNPNFYLLAAFLILIPARPYCPTEAAAIVVESLASAVIVFIVYYVDEGPFQWFCSLPVIKFLGEISYSLYILSFLAVHMMGTWLYHCLGHDFITRYGLLANLAATAVVAIACVSISTITFYTLERPFMKLGRWFTERVNLYLESSAYSKWLGSLKSLGSENDIKAVSNASMDVPESI